jgi:multidrug efflux pump subunit AcrB
MKRADLYKGPISWMARNPVASNLLMLVLIVGGLIMSFRIRQEVFPSIELDKISITVPYPGASPEEVEQGILLAIEESVRTLDGVKEVTSTAAEGVGYVSVELEVGIDRNKALSDVKNHIDRIVTFPEEAEEPIVSLPEYKREALWVVVHGDVPMRVLHELGEQARDKLLEHPDISYVELSGVKPLEISVEIPQETLRRHGLTLPGVADRVRRTALELPAGGVKTEGGEVLLRTAERRDLGTEFADIPVAVSADGTTLELGRIASIEDGYAEVDMAAHFEGQPCVMAKVYSVGQESPTRVARAALEVAEELRGTLPPGIGVDKWRDYSELYDQRLDLLLRNAAIGLALVLVILGLFLEPRLAFWVTMGIPISFLGSFLVLPAMDVSLNMMSLFAFIVTLGMVVDDAIVVGENAFRHRREGKGFVESAVIGAREMAMPVTFSIATTVCAFSPLLFIPGPRGKWMFAIPVVAISVLVLSLVESFFVLPGHVAHVGRPGSLMSRVVRYQSRFSRGVESFIARVYAPLVRFALRNRGLTLAVGVALFLGALGLMKGGQVEMIDFPREESDWVFADAGLQYGVAPEETEEVMQRMVRAAREAIAENGGERINEGIFSVMGLARTTRGWSEGSHLTQVGVFLVPTDERDISSSEFARIWRDKLGEIPGLEFIKFDSSTGHGETPPIDVMVSHRDPEVIEKAARDLSAELETFAGVEDVDDGIELGKPQLDFELSEAGKRAGLTSRDIAAQVRSAFYGSEALRQQRGRNELKVMVRLPREERESLENVEELMLLTPRGGEMPLRSAAEVERGRAYTEINRVDGKRILRVQAGVVEGEANTQDIMQELFGTTLPELRRRHQGLSWERAGRQKSMQEFVDYLIVGFGFALLGIYGLIAVPLRSFVQPLMVVMIAIPFGFVGAVLGHWILDLKWSLISWTGLVAVSGVVVNDSLVYAASANRFRESGLRRFKAAEMAGRQRFRPILLTSLTTFGGLAPMIFETSTQARVLVPMAVSLGFGVLFATFVILLLVPCLYAMAERPREWWRRRRAERMGDEPGGEA